MYINIECLNDVYITKHTILTFERWIYQVGEIDFSSPIWRVGRIRFEDKLHLKSTFDWASVWKEWIWKVIRWISPPHLGWRRFATQLHRMSIVSLINDLHVYNDLFVMWIVSFQVETPILKHETEKMNFNRSEPVTSIKAAVTTIERIIIFNCGQMTTGKVMIQSMWVVKLSKKLWWHFQQSK